MVALPDRLAALHGHIRTEGSFVAHAGRFLIEACKLGLRPPTDPVRRV
jgi:hypothetical protein